MFRYEVTYIIHSEEDNILDFQTKKDLEGKGSTSLQKALMIEKYRIESMNVKLLNK